MPPPLPPHHQETGRLILNWQKEYGQSVLVWTVLRESDPSLYCRVFEVWPTATTQVPSPRAALLLLCSVLTFCVLCTAPDKQYEKQHSHQPQRQHYSCCTGTLPLLSTCLSVHPSVYLVIYLSICLSVCLSCYQWVLSFLCSFFHFIWLHPSSCLKVQMNKCIKHAHMCVCASLVMYKCAGVPDSEQVPWTGSFLIRIPFPRDIVGLWPGSV